MVTFDEFKKLEIKVAEIKEAKEHPNADKLYVVKIDIGGEERQVVAGIKDFYKAQELIGKKVVAIVNLKPATIRGEESAGMILACRDDKGLCLLVPEKDMEIGSKIS